MNKAIVFAILLAASPANALALCWPECVSSTPLDETTVAITAQGVGFFSVGQNENVLVEAARQTLAHGYTHFRLTNPQDYTQYAPRGFNAYSNGMWSYGNVNSARYGTSSAIVHMGASGLNARSILQQYGD